MVDNVNMNASMYMLISVLNRDIMTECFTSLSEAYCAMKKELIDTLDEYDYMVDPSVYKSEEYDNNVYGFGSDCAYINDIEDSSYYCQCDWRIIPVCTPIKDNIKATVVVNEGLVTDVYSNTSELKVGVIDLDDHVDETDNAYTRLINDYDSGLTKHVW